MNDELAQVKRKVEAEIGFTIPAAVADDVLSFTKKKLEVITRAEKKDDDYIVLLYEDELRNYYAIEAINAHYERKRRVG